jgi:hypothetical protein
MHFSRDYTLIEKETLAYYIIARRKKRYGSTYIHEALRPYIRDMKVWEKVRPVCSIKARSITYLI